MRAIVIVLLSIILIGCGTTIRPINDLIALHPDLPRPIGSVQIDWRILEKDDQVYVGAEYNDFLDLLEYQSDTLRYIRQMRTTVCYYRIDLEETYCTGPIGDIIQ